MDKAVLKKFAIESRQDLMQRMEKKIKTFYIDEEFSKQQSGDVYILANNKHSLNLSKEEYTKRELLIKRINELGLEQVIEEAAYTWFNRIVAIRYMEIHDYLPLTRDNQSLGIRVLSSKDNTPDPEIMKFTNLVNPELDIDFKKEKYVELKDDNEKFKYILLLVCRKLGRVIPQVFDGITDYIDILIPDNLLNESGFVNKIITEVPEENYEQVEIIGWLYQYYNQTEKDRVISAKKAYKKNEIPYATQLFTPDWIVKYMVENSLGRIALENFTGIELNSKCKYLINNGIKFNKVYNNLSEIKLLDPCCGSGHILVYSFELFYELYNQLGYNKNDICELIFSNNIFGLDIDNRACQLSILSIILKAREFDKNIFNNNVISQLNIMSIPEINDIEKSLLDELNSDIYKKQVNELIETFKNGKTIGSLIKVKNEDYKNLFEHIEKVDNIFAFELRRKILPLIKCANVMMNKYEIVVTNPPYLPTGRMNNDLKTYINKNYKKSKSDLCTAFMENQFVKEKGYLAMINQHSWMFLGSFEDLRDDIITNNGIVNLVHLGTRAFEEIGGEVVQTVSFIMKKQECINNTVFINLTSFENANLKEEKYIDIINKKENYYIINSTREFKNIPGITFAYWATRKDGEIYRTNKKISDYGVACVGLQTSDNNRFLRKWYEINFEKIGFKIRTINESIESSKKWFPYNKGGGFRRWFGNNEDLVNWENDGKEIRDYNNYLNSTRSSNIGIANTQYYFKESGTWGLVSNNFSVRYSPVGAIFDTGGSSLFINNNLKYIIGFLNTKLAQKFLLIQNPTLNFQPGNVSNIPVIMNEKHILEVTQIVDKNIDISKQDWDNFETSWDFKKNPLINISKDLWDATRVADSRDYYGKSIEASSPLELSWYLYNGKCNEQFKKLKENEEELNKIFIDIYGVQDELTPEVEDKDVTIRKADKVRDIKALISYAVGCMFGRYSLDQEGLIYASGSFDASKYKKFKADTDNIIPITDEAYFPDDIVSRFKEFIEVVYGKESLNSNLDFIAETLGKKGTETSEETIRRYFVNDFFNDHCKIYQKRPIYWLLDSGKKNGFKALIYMHRYNENLIPKARLDYLHRIQTTYEKLLSDVNYKLTTDLSMVDKKDAQKRQADLNAKLQEIKEYDEKIAHIANQRISIDLDDGVKTNYEKFKDILAKIK